MRTISNLPAASSTSERPTCPSRPVTSMRMRSGLRGLEHSEPLTRIALAEGSPPPLVVEIPAHGLFDARLECFLRSPAEFCFELGGVYRVSRVMPRAVDDELDQFLARPILWSELVESFADASHDIDVSPLVSTTDVVGLPDASAFGHGIQRPDMVLDIEQVADVLALAVDRN